MLRRVIRIPATESPNVALALAQQAAGEEPTGERVLDGVLTWEEYLQRRRTWDPIRQCVGIDACWYTGAEVRLFPRELMDAVVARHDRRPPTGPVRYMGVDPAEGGDRSAWIVIDSYGVLELVSERTPDTNSVFYRTLELMDRWGIRPQDVCMDRGSGKQHADRLAMAGYPVRTVAFGESVSLPIRSGMRILQERVDVKEDQSIYRNRRTEMYWEAANLLQMVGQYQDGEWLPPEERGTVGAARAVGFAIPRLVADWKTGDRKSLRQQLEAIPREYDREGRPYLRSKSNDPGSATVDLDGRPTGRSRGRKSLKDLVGHSPDEADAFVLALYAMREQPLVLTAGVS